MDGQVLAPPPDRILRKGARGQTLNVDRIFIITYFVRNEIDRGFMQIRHGYLTVSMYTREKNPHPKKLLDNLDATLDSQLI